MILTIDEVDFLHELAISQHGGILGKRDPSIIESALHQPCQTFGGQDLYPTMLSKIASLGFGLIMNHGYIDGNKRVGFLAMAITLQRHVGQVLYEPDEAEEICLGVANGTVNREQLQSWLERITLTV